jgi:hypothetical protein
LIIFLVIYLIYFLYLKIKINKERLKLLERQNKEYDNAGK